MQKEFSTWYLKVFDTLPTSLRGGWSEHEVQGYVRTVDPKGFCANTGRSNTRWYRWGCYQVRNSFNHSWRRNSTDMGYSTERFMRRLKRHGFFLETDDTVSTSHSGRKTCISAGSALGVPLAILREWMLVLDDVAAAAENTSADVVRVLLEAGGAEQLQVKGQCGSVPMHLAAAQNASADVVWMLLEAGGVEQLHATDQRGRHQSRQ